jgi:hypothetical protein
VASRRYSDFGGMTVFKIIDRGLFTQSLAVIFADVTYVSAWRKHWVGTLETAILDEISMLSGQFLVKFPKFLQYMFGNELPMGGIQIIICGDFLQLLPFSRGSGLQPMAAFECAVWQELQLEQFVLTHNYRVATGDQEFIRMLELTRLGIASTEVCKFWRSLGPKPSEDLSAHTHLFFGNAQCDNDTSRARIDGLFPSFPFQ